MAAPEMSDDASTYSSLADSVLVLANDSPGAISSETASYIRLGLDVKMESTAQYTCDLMRGRAGGLGDPVTALSAKQRMTSPRYFTTPLRGIGRHGSGADGIKGAAYGTCTYAPPAGDLAALPPLRLR